MWEFENQKAPPNSPHVQFESYSMPTKHHAQNYASKNWKTIMTNVKNEKQKPSVPL